jgi:L-alanine-DL-glutamate epimerase-like enolase superfamily enzyme
MQIEKVKIYPVLLPFALDFSHSLRKRSSVKNIIVEVIAQKGNISGYGEGAPRPYVTGETPAIAAKNIRRFIRQNNFPWTLNHVSQIWDFVFPKITVLIRFITVLQFLWPAWRPF